MGCRGPGGRVHAWGYDPVTDTMPEGHECYWRAKTGSPKDCRDFWRGTPPKSDDTEPAADGGTAPEVEAAAPDESEG